MPITAEQRHTANRVATEWHTRHKADQHSRGWTPNKLTSQQIHRIGFLGEFAYFNRYGGAEVDLTYRPGGDQGADNVLGIHPVDVKTLTFRGPGACLLVPVNRMNRSAIYVAASYMHEADDIELVGWEWGWRLVKENRIRTFPPHNTHNYTKLFTKLTPMTELDKIARWFYPHKP